MNPSSNSARCDRGSCKSRHGGSSSASLISYSLLRNNELGERVTGLLEMT